MLQTSPFGGGGVGAGLLLHSLSAQPPHASGVSELCAADCTIWALEVAASGSGGILTHFGTAVTGATAGSHS